MNDSQKLSLLNDVGEIINKNDKDDENLKKYVSDVLINSIEECNESWCDNCKIRQATGMFCNEYLNI